jgi:regulation of enolase protein 1 (concanavalin A-like superfamily)
MAVGPQHRSLPVRFDFDRPDDRGAWLNAPPEWRIDGGLHLVTGARTDFWQRTHYGFRRDDGHVFHLLVPGDFTLETRVRWVPRSQYDQCGLMVRAGPESWLKCAVEHEGEHGGRLGSVVTNLGFSDWSTQDVGPQVRAMSYRVSRRDDDFLVECSADGRNWLQLRVAHLHDCPDELAAGAYACSPVGERFGCTFEYLDYRPCQWAAHG